MSLLKTWILNWKWVKDARIEAFTDAQKDILLTFDDDYINPKVEKEVERRLLALLTTVDSRQVVSVDKQRGIVYIGGEKADENTLLNLKSEAEFFRQSNLWKLIYETPKKLAENAMFRDDGKLETQLVKGRAILFTLSTQNNILSTFESFERKP